MTYFSPTKSTKGIVEQLRGTWSGDRAMCLCPAHDDHTPSLSIRQGKTSILVHCFAGCTGSNVMSAIRGLRGHSIEYETASPAKPRSNTSIHKKLWQEAINIKGTLAERYLLETRGLHQIPPDVRFHPNCPRGPKGSVVFEPALLVGIFHQQMLNAVQRIFLDPKSAQYTRKMAIGKLGQGSWPNIVSGSHNSLAEGFETAAAFTQITDQPASACFGIRRFDLVTFPENIKFVTFLPDNRDPDAILFAERGLEKLKTAGVAGRIKLPPKRFEDWAEIIQ